MSAIARESISTLKDESAPIRARLFAQRWIFGEEGEALSFRNICATLGVNVDAARKELVRFRVPVEEDRLYYRTQYDRRSP